MGPVEPFGGGCRGDSSPPIRPVPPRFSIQVSPTDGDDDDALLGSQMGSPTFFGSLSPLSDMFSPREDLEKTRSGGCCGVQRGFHRFFRSRGLDSTWHWTRVTCALIGANVLWVGGWNLVAYDCAFTPTSGPCVQIPDGNASGLVYMPQPGTLRSHFNRLPHDPGVGSSNPFADTLPSWLGGSNTIAFRGEITVVIGWVLMLMSDSLYTVFSETGMFSWMHRNELKNTAGGRLLYAVRMILGLVGQHLFWAGLYIFVLTTPPLLTWTFCDEVGGCALDMLIHAVVFAVGIVLLIATGTWSAATFLYNPDDEDGEANLLQRWCWMHDVEDPLNMTRLDHVRYTVRATLSIFAQNLLWVSSGRALDYTIPASGDLQYRVLFFTSFGLMLVAMTESVAANSWIVDIEERIEDDMWSSSAENGINQDSKYESTDQEFGDTTEFDAQEKIEKRDRAVWFYFVSFISLCGQLIFIYGFWIVLDPFWVPTYSGTAVRGTWLTYRSTEINIYYVIVGSALVSLGGALATNAGLAAIPVYATTTATLGTLQDELTRLERRVMDDIDDRASYHSRVSEVDLTLRSIDALRDMTTKFRRPKRGGQAAVDSRPRSRSSPWVGIGDAMPGRSRSYEPFQRGSLHGSPQLSRHTLHE